MPDVCAFHDLSAFVALPRVAGLALSPDGTRLITSTSELSSDGTRYVPALWEIDPAGVREPVRLTRSERGESAPAFLPDGSLAFLSPRPDPDPADQRHRGRRGGTGSTAKQTAEKAVWVLPERGEPRQLLTRPGGISEFAVARDRGLIAFTATVLPGTDDTEGDSELREARASAEVSAILYEAGPVRYWDSDLGPGVPHQFVTDPTDDEPPTDAGPRGHIATGAALSADGSLIAYTARVGQLPAQERSALVIADAATGERLRVLDSPDHEYIAPVFHPDGTAVVCVRETRATWEHPSNYTLWELPLGDPDSPGRDLTPEFDQWPRSPAVSPTGDVYFVADEQGHCPVFRRSTGGVVTRLTASGAHGDLVISPDGNTVYALHNTIDCPPTPVRLDAHATDQRPAPLKAPGGVGRLPGTLTEVTTTADDGAPLRGWLVLPEGASASTPAPLLVFVGGGPETSWSTWHWRWNPWTAAARGYAVLLPDRALSTGYGQHNQERGWGGWGHQPYRDVLAVTDTALKRTDLDPTRTALMGGSYGGYMANWVAGHTDRFKAIVTHACSWNLTNLAQYGDVPGYFQTVFGNPAERTERYDANSPHHHIGNISTPMLVIHGAKDFRTPFGDAMLLWHELRSREVPSKFLYFPDENHWILSPNNAKVWYTTVLNFLDHHVLGKEWVRPDLL